MAAKPSAITRAICIRRREKRVKNVREIVKLVVGADNAPTFFVERRRFLFLLFTLARDILYNIYAYTYARNRMENGGKDIISYKFKKIKKKLKKIKKILKNLKKTLAFILCKWYYV